MTPGPAAPSAPTVWRDAAHAAALLAVDPHGLGGAWLRAPAGDVRERWLAALRRLLPEGTPWRRVPLGIPDARLLGGMDLAATLASGRPVAQQGLLADADNGVVLLPMAERLAPGTAARLAAVLDRGEVVLARDGFAFDAPARVAAIVLDEGADDDERPPAALVDRVAFCVDLTALSLRDVGGEEITPSAARVAQARALLPDVRAPGDIVDALCAAAWALGIVSLRVPAHALRAARAAAALAGRRDVAQEDAALAARLVLAPRATRIPASEDGADADESPPESSAEATDSPPHDDPAGADRIPDELVLAAVHALLPPQVLALARDAARWRRRSASGGRAGHAQASALRGRPVGVARGEPGRGTRLAVVETLRAAAPWQRLRDGGRGRVQVRKDDFRIARFRQHTTTTTVFVVDASGSSAAHRLAEAKGAVELLLAECYVRRDRVALIAFRGTGSELVLPPTRSLARAKRGLAGLPGGGGTPLAAGLDAARALADALARRGESPTIVLLTDGRANVARDGAHSRERAAADAQAAARAIRAAGVAAIVIDTSPQPQPQARDLAAAMDARYLPLPHADAAMLSRALALAS